MDSGILADLVGCAGRERERMEDCREGLKKGVMASPGLEPETFSVLD